MFENELNLIGNIEFIEDFITWCSLGEFIDFHFDSIISQKDTVDVIDFHFINFYKL